MAELVETGKAFKVDGIYGFWTFTAPAEHIVPRILDGPPEAKPETLGLKDETYPFARRSIDHDAAKQFRCDEWLLIEAWDED